MTRKTSRLLRLAAVGLTVALAAGTAAVAHAFPTRTSPCYGCHSTNSSVSVTANETSNDGVNATYEVSVSNPFGGTITGWAVFDAGTNIRNGYGAGTFSVAVGRSYTVYGVAGAGGQGSNSVVISPLAPPPPPPPVLQTSTLNVSVTSQAGAPLSGAKIVLRNAATGARYTGQTSAIGTAEFTALPYGDYSVIVSARGYKRAAARLLADAPAEELAVTLAAR